MCTPVYVTVKAAASMAPVISYIFGALVLAVGSFICYFKAFRVKAREVSS